MQLRLHNTATRRKEAFEPLDPKRVRLYVCGPTVYQRIHVGNARAFVVFDVLYRLLRHLYGAENVVYVRNITDIDDKIIDQAAKNGEDIRSLTERTTADFHADLAALGCLPPTHEPRATEHVPGMVALIQRLIERGHAYAAEGHVLFSVPSMPDYGRLSGRNREEQIAGARVDVAPYKHDPADFVLWKPSPDGLPGWDSPWGRGRPGWHIECSAMSEAFLAPLPFDIHAGGLDLIFPHHENEIAQSCCAHGIDQMARYWLHNGFLDMRGEKMSKSLGNVLRIPAALEMARVEKPGELVRLALLTAHYRSPADFDQDVLDESLNQLEFWYNTLYKFRSASDDLVDEVFVYELCDDLNFPEAVARLTALARRANRTSSDEAAAKLRGSARLIGLLQSDPEQWRRYRPQNTLRVTTAELVGVKTASRTIIIDDDLTQDDINELIDWRMQQRMKKDYVGADRVRNVLKRVGVILEDRPDGTTDWRRA